MNTLAIDLRIAKIEDVRVSEDGLTVVLGDGRTISAPLAWYPRLTYGSKAELDNWRLIGKGEGIHWEELDEDISVEHLLAGIPSGESQKSLRRWLKKRENPSEK